VCLKPPFLNGYKALQSQLDISSVTQRLPHEVDNDVPGGLLASREGPGLVLHLPVVEDDCLPGLCQSFVEEQVVVHAPRFEVVFIIISSGGLQSPDPCLPSLGDVVAADESDAGQLGVVLVYPLRCRAVRVVLAGVSSDSDQNLIINSDIVASVDVLLGMVHLGQEHHVHGRHGHGQGASRVGVRDYRVASRPVPSVVDPGSLLSVGSDLSLAKLRTGVSVRSAELIVHLIDEDPVEGVPPVLHDWLQVLGKSLMDVCRLDQIHVLQLGSKVLHQRLHGVARDKSKPIKFQVLLYCKQIFGGGKTLFC